MQRDVYTYTVYTYIYIFVYIILISKGHDYHFPPNMGVQLQGHEIRPRLHWGIPNFQGKMVTQTN